MDEMDFRDIDTGIHGGDYDEPQIELDIFSLHVIYREVLSKLAKILQHDIGNLISRMSWIGVPTMIRDQLLNEYGTLGITKENLKELLQRNSIEATYAFLHEQPKATTLMLKSIIDILSLDVLDWLSTLNQAIKKQLERTIKLLTEEPKPHPVNLLDVIKKTIDFIKIKHLRDSKQFVLKEHYLIPQSEYPNLSIIAIPGLLETILTNLISNAIEVYVFDAQSKRTEQQRLTIDLVISYHPHQAINPRASNQNPLPSGGNYVVIGVHDSHTGMTPRILEQLQKHISLGLDTNITNLDTHKDSPSEEHGVGLILCSWLHAFQVQGYDLPFIVRAYNGLEMNGELNGFHFDLCIPIASPL